MENKLNDFRYLMRDIEGIEITPRINKTESNLCYYISLLPLDETQRETLIRMVSVNIAAVESEAFNQGYNRCWDVLLGPEESE